MPLRRTYRRPRNFRRKNRTLRKRKLKGGYTPTMRRCGSGLCSVGRPTIVTFRGGIDPDSVPQFVSELTAEEMRSDQSP